jgi:hypothetical protein
MCRDDFREGRLLLQLFQRTDRRRIRPRQDGRYVVFAEVAVPRALFAKILGRIDRLRGSPMVTA